MIFPSSISFIKHSLLFLFQYFAVHANSHRAIIDQANLHIRTEYAAFHTANLTCENFFKILIKSVGFIGLGDGQFVVSAYPVRVQFTDIILVLASVLLVSAISVWLPIRLLNRFFYNRTQQ